MNKQVKRTVIAEDIRRRRKTLNMTQSEMAERLGINRNRYARYETNTEPPINLISKMAEIFGITTDELLHGTSGYAADIRNSAIQKQKVSTFLSYNSGEIKKDDFELSEDEKLLVMRFRMLTDEQKDALMELLKQIV